VSEPFSLILFIYGLAIAIAMGAALLIKLIVGALAFSESRSQAQAAQAAPAAPAPTAPVVEDGIPAHHVVAIAAAAHAVLGAHRILHIGAATSGRIWSTEGRLAQHSSHHPSHH
jgi:hypothetical protein